MRTLLNGNGTGLPWKEGRIKGGFLSCYEHFSPHCPELELQAGKQSWGKCVEEPAVTFAGVPGWLLDRQGLAEQLCEAQESWVPRVIVLTPLQRYLIPLQPTFSSVEGQYTYLSSLHQSDPPAFMEAPWGKVEHAVCKPMYKHQGWAG